MIEGDHDINFDHDKGDAHLKRGPSPILGWAQTSLVGVCTQPEYAWQWLQGYQINKIVPQW